MSGPIVPQFKNAEREKEKREDELDALQSREKRACGQSERPDMKRYNFYWCGEKGLCAPNLAWERKAWRRTQNPAPVGKPSNDCGTHM